MVAVEEDSVAESLESVLVGQFDFDWTTELPILVVVAVAAVPTAEVPGFAFVLPVAGLRWALATSLAGSAPGGEHRFQYPLV